MANRQDDYIGPFPLFDWLVGADFRVPKSCTEIAKPIRGHVARGVCGDSSNLAPIKDT